MFTVTIKFFMQDTVKYTTDALGLQALFARYNMAHVATITIESDKD